MSILQYYLESLQTDSNLGSFLSSFKKVIRFTTETQHQIGLLKYKTIPKDIAFLFEFDDNEIRNFHTIKMNFSINIYFYDERGNLINKYINAEPGIKNISSKEECKFVVETLA
jgi:uncharacterized membrane protein (UPF0127 family)